MTEHRKPLTDWMCSKCGGTLASVWIAQYASDEWLDAALDLHEMNCESRTADFTTTEGNTP